MSKELTPDLIAGSIKQQIRGSRWICRAAVAVALIAGVQGSEALEADNEPLAIAAGVELLAAAGTILYEPRRAEKGLETLMGMYALSKGLDLPVDRYHRPLLRIENGELKEAEEFDITASGGMHITEVSSPAGRTTTTLSMVSAACGAFLWDQLPRLDVLDSQDRFLIGGFAVSFSGMASVAILTHEAHFSTMQKAYLAQVNNLEGPKGIEL